MRALLAALLLLSAPALAFEGPVKVPDGDTLHYSMRLWGIDTPEKKQQCRNTGGCYPCGRVAADVLKRMTRDREIRCEPTGDRTYGRMVAICYDGSKDLNLEMLRQGWAVVYGKYINDVPAKTNAYLEAQKQANNRRIGLWSGEFVSPKGWRKGERLEGCE